MRKFSFNLPISLAVLETQIAKDLHLQGPPASIKFEYMDEDKDFVTVKTDQEFQLSCEPGCTSHRITFSVHPEPQPEPQPEPLPYEDHRVPHRLPRPRHPTPPRHNFLS